MIDFLDIKIENSKGSYLESIPDYLMERILAKLLFVHESYKNEDGSFGVYSLVKQVEFRGNSIHFVFQDNSKRDLKEEGKELVWVSSEDPLLSLSNKMDLLVRLKDIVTNPRLWK